MYIVKMQISSICLLFVIAVVKWYLFLITLRKEQTGMPSSITRFDNAMAVQIGGSQARGYSSGDAIKCIERGRQLKHYQPVIHMTGQVNLVKS